MTLGISLTSIHVALSLIAILAGLVWLADLLKGTQKPLATGLFLVTTLATTVTGFMFPFSAITPAFVVGAVSLVALAIALAALYVFKLGGAWRTAYTVSAMFAFYLNAFVAVVQSFQKIGPLQRLAPTQSEPPFIIAQAVLLFAFVLLGWMAQKSFLRMSNSR